MLTDEDKQWINERLEERKQRIIERLEKLKITMLNAFHGGGSPEELRQRSHAAALRAHDAELESMSDRPKNLEHQ